MVRFRQLAKRSSLDQDYVDNRSTVHATVEDPRLRFGRLGDMNGDGFDDIWLVQSNDEIRVLLGQADLADLTSSELTQLVWEAGPVISSPNGMTERELQSLGDLNSDRYVDFLVRWDNSVQVLFGGTHWTEQLIVMPSDLNRTRGFLMSLERRAATDFQFAANDFNLDGTSDFVVLDEEGLIRVEFGGQGIGQDGIRTLASLGTDNGFRLSVPEPFVQPGYYPRAILKKL